MCLVGAGSGSYVSLRAVGFAVVVGRVYSLPFRPPGACFSPAWAVLQLFCSVTGTDLGIEGKKETIYY